MKYRLTDQISEDGIQIELEYHLEDSNAGRSHGGLLPALRGASDSAW